MKPETRLDSAMFQLTPTRTRCDLVIIANGENEKVASGLLNPFLSHLKTAQEQIAKGGYSIVLEPNSESKHASSWFTKTTLERFVRFVSTPEVLERVNTIESEIIQIDEAIAIQSNTKLGLMAVDDHQVKPVENNEGGRYVPDADTEKAIVLYKPSAHQIESKESTLQEENSKVKLLRVLETRRTVLQKEQGMAFARAVAAGFDMDHMDDLISFADCFGASRLREACLHFVELWKRKHETVQWIEGMEMEAAEGISCPSGLQVPWAVGHGDIYMENSVKTKTEASSDRNIEHMADLTGDRRSPVDPQVPLGQNGYFQGQFQHPMYMQWPIHPPHGGSMFPPYPMPGMPYYPGYPGGGQFFQQPYVQMDNSSFSPAERNMHKRHSMDGKDGDVDSESITRSHDSSEQNAQLEMDREESYIHESRKKVSRTGKKRSGMVVIRNINYITSNREHSGDAESQSGSGSEAEEEEVPVSFQKRKHKDSVRSTKEEAKHLQAADVSSSYEKEESSKCVDVDNGNWQAFQNFLLSKDEDDTDRDMFSLHSDVQMRRRDTAAAADSIVADRSWDRNSNQITSERDVFGSNVSLLRKKGQSDESTKAFANNTRRDLGDHHDVQVSESEGRSRGFRRMLSDDFLTYGHRNQTIIVGSSCDPIAGNETEHHGFADKNIGQGPEDESFMVPLRTSSQTQVDRDSRTNGLDLEFLSNLKKREDSDKPIGYVPDELSMIPERGTERSYDPAVDYEMQIQADMSFVANGSNLPKELKDESKVIAKQEKKAVDKEKKNVIRCGTDKRKAEAMRNLKPTKSSPLAEAQARADRLRAFKADLQKAKKEQQDEQIKRLEALKKERQKRIAARSSSMQSPSPSQLTKVRQSTKVSPGLLKSSKFSDSEAASPSPIPKMGARSGTVGSNSSTKVLKTSTPSVTRVGNGLTRSASSVPEFKKENGVGSSDAKATMTRLRRLSEPKSISNRLSDGKSTPRRRETNGLRSKISPVNRLDRARTSAAAILKNTRSSAESDGLGKKISPLSKVDGTKPSSAASFKDTSSPSAHTLQNKVTTKESTIGSSDNQVCLSSSVERKTSDSGMCLSNTDETMIIDKSVLTIEHEVSTSHASKESKELTSGSHDGHTVEEKVKVVSDYAAIRVLPSNVAVNKIDSKEKQIKQAVDEMSSKFPRVTINEVQYQAPHARKSSLEDPCAGNSEYSKALPLISEASAAGEPVKAHVLESSWSSPSKPTVDGSDKSSGKESKGFKRLLKFGLRSHGSASGEKESGQRKADGDILDDSAPKGESGFEVHSLKNLISQDDTYSEGGTPHKASRSFSLLSPFRSKKAGQ